MLQGSVELNPSKTILLNLNSPNKLGTATMCNTLSVMLVQVIRSNEVKPIESYFGKIYLLSAGLK